MRQIAPDIAREAQMISDFMEGSDRPRFVHIGADTPKIIHLIIHWTTLCPDDCRYVHNRDRLC